MSEEIKITIKETTNAFIVKGSDGFGNDSSATFFKTNPLAEHLAKEQATQMKVDLEMSRSINGNQ